MNILSSLFSTQSTEGEHTKFVILFFERSGSSWLADMLNNHPEVSCLPEVFSLNWNSEDKEKVGQPIHTTEAEIKEQLNRIYTKPKTKARGFKFKYPLQVNSYPLVADFLEQQKKDIRLVFLYRKNRLKGAISSQNNRRLRAINKQSNLRVGESALEPLQLNIPNAVKYVKQRERADFQFFKKAKQFKHLHVVTYEDLLVKTPEVLNGVYEFLGVNTDHILQTKFQKVTPDSIKEAITNYDRLCKRLRCHPMEKYLDF